jgi:hypothetical protein
MQDDKRNAKNKDRNEKEYEESLVQWNNRPSLGLLRKQ